MSAPSISPRALFEILRFVWKTGSGYRLRPWRNPYLLWRIETYSGQKADTVTPGKLLYFLWNERRRLAHYLRWTGAMRMSGLNRRPYNRASRPPMKTA